MPLASPDDERELAVFQVSVAAVLTCAHPTAATLTILCDTVQRFAGAQRRADVPLDRTVAALRHAAAAALPGRHDRQAYQRILDDVSRWCAEVYDSP